MHNGLPYSNPHCAVQIALISRNAPSWAPLLTRSLQLGGVEIRLRNITDEAFDLSSTRNDPPFDLIVLDLSSLDGGFKQNYRSIRSRYPKHGLLLVVDQSDEADALKCIAEGVENYLISEQFSEREFVRIVSTSVIHSKCRFVLQQARDELAANHQRYHAIVEDQTDLIRRILPNGKITFVNESFCRYFDRNQKDLIGVNFLEFVAPEDHKRVRLHLDQLSGNTPFATIVCSAVLPDLSVRFHHWIDRVIFDQSGRVIEYQSVGRDITEQLQTEENLRLSERRFRTILDSNADGIIIIDEEKTIKFLNRACEEILCRKASHLLFAKCDFIQSLVPRMEIEMFDPLGRKKIIEVRVNAIEMDGQPHWIASLRDLTELCSLREELKSMTWQDTLTSISNRRGFFNQAEQLRQIAQRQGRGLMMMFIDLDGLKAINDRFGHIAGDQALIDTASILKESSRKSDVVARIGGDEFAVLGLENRANTSSVPRRRVNMALRRFNGKSMRPYQIAISIGIACQHAGEELSIERLMLDSDQSMYQHKRSKQCAV